MCTWMAKYRWNFVLFSGETQHNLNIHIVFVGLYCAIDHFTYVFVWVETQSAIQSTYLFLCICMCRNHHLFSSHLASKQRSIHYQTIQFSLWLSGILYVFCVCFFFVPCFFFCSVATHLCVYVNFDIQIFECNSCAGICLRHYSIPFHYNFLFSSLNLIILVRLFRLFFCCNVIISNNIRSYLWLDVIVTGKIKVSVCSDFENGFSKIEGRKKRKKQMNKWTNEIKTSTIVILVLVEFCSSQFNEMFAPT